MATVAKDTAVGSQLARLEKTARLTRPGQQQRGGVNIHSDEWAQSQGFKGGLVPGITLWGYMNEMLTNSFGNEWLSRGKAKFRFRQPVYDLEQVVCCGVVKEREETAEGVRLVLDVWMDAPEDRKSVVGEVTWLVK